MTAIAIQHREEILEQVAQGAMLQTIAEKLGIAPQNISKHLASDPEYRESREIGAELRLHLAYSRMDQCAEGSAGIDEEGNAILVADERGTLARAREAAFRAAAWFAEREFPHRWAPRSHVTVEHTGDLGDRLRRSKERVIEGKCERVAPDAVQQLPESVSYPQK